MESIVAQLKDNYGKIVFAHEAHKQSGEILLFRLRCLENLQVVLSVINTAAIIAIFFKMTTYTLISALVTSLILLVLQLFFRKSDIAILAEQHTEAAAHLEQLRESYLTLMTDISDEKLFREEVEKERNRLKEQLSSCYQHGNPEILERARKKVKRFLKLKEKCGFSEKEMEGLLPVYLRKQTAE